MRPRRRGATLTLLTVALVACGSPRAPTPMARVSSDGGPLDASVLADADPARDGENSHPKNDVSCDAANDIILPDEANACSTARFGACGTGFASCEDGKRVCNAPPPLPEVIDGIDNDCNGVVDDVPAAQVHPRAFVVMPKYVWSDAAADVANVTALLDQAGIPFDRQAVSTDWDASLAALSNYSLVIVPGYLLGSVVRPSVTKALEDFARQGGVVIVMKPVGTAEQPNAWKLVGLTSSVRRRDVSEIRFDGSPAAALADLDSPEERRIPIAEDHARDPIEVYALETNAADQTTALAHAFVDGKAIGPAITRRPMGRGAIYALGHDLTTFAHSRCYVNCFEPSGDLLRLIFEGALREASRGHVALKHTVPGAARSLVILSHDVDAPDAMNAGAWGQPGALQMAAMERSHGVRATYNITTDYVAGYFNPQVVEDLCSAGMCPLGAHSVRHSEAFGAHPVGSCAETRATYVGKVPATLCGEVRVSTQILADITGRLPRAWRSPYLALNPKQFDVLADRGIVIDSGFGVGDLKYNLPVDLRAVGFKQELFHHRAILEFPVACEDGIGKMVNGVLKREELQASNAARFVALWTYIVLRNAANRSMTTVLVHTSRGRDQPDENLAVKIASAEKLVLVAERAGIPVLPIEEVADFWQARQQVALDATFDDKIGYTGTLAVGKLPITRMTIELGDVIKSFTCAKCGPTVVSGRRVVIESTLAAGTRVEFVAAVR